MGCLWATALVRRAQRVHRGGLPVHVWPGRWQVHRFWSARAVESDHAEAVWLEAFPTCHTPAVTATACVVPFLLGPATAALGRMSPWHMKLRCLALAAAFLLGVSSMVWTRQPPTASMLARFRLPACPSVHAWLLRLRTGSDVAPERLPALDPALHYSAPVCRGAVADARLGLA